MLYQDYFKSIQLPITLRHWWFTVCIVKLCRFNILSHTQWKYSLPLWVHGYSRVNKSVKCLFRVFQSNPSLLHWCFVFKDYFYFDFGSAIINSVMIQLPWPISVILFLFALGHSQYILRSMSPPMCRNYARQEKRSLPAFIFIFIHLQHAKKRRISFTAVVI